MKFEYMYYWIININEPLRHNSWGFFLKGIMQILSGKQLNAFIFLPIYSIASPPPPNISSAVKLRRSFMVTWILPGFWLASSYFSCRKQLIRSTQGSPYHPPSSSSPSLSHRKQYSRDRLLEWKSYISKSKIQNNEEKC